MLSLIAFNFGSLLFTNFFRYVSSDHLTRKCLHYNLVVAWKKNRLKIMVSSFPIDIVAFGFQLWLSFCVTNFFRSRGANSYRGLGIDMPARVLGQFVVVCSGYGSCFVDLALIMGSALQKFA